MHPIDPSALDGSDGFRLIGQGDDRIFGTSVSHAGDLNGDGFDDIIVGAAQSDRAYVVFGQETPFLAEPFLDGAGILRLDGPADGDAGYDVRLAGDVNGDGVDDVVVNDRLNYQAHVVFGRTDGFAQSLAFDDLDGGDGFSIDGGAFGRLAGYAIGGAGDINGDGIADIVFGSPEADPTEAGAVHVVFGSTDAFAATVDLATLDSSQGFRIGGVEIDDNLGFAVDRLGDMNGDGLDDLLITAQTADPDGGFDAGKGYVVFGRQDGGFGAALDLDGLDGDDGFRLDAAEPNGLIGRAAAGAGDVNGDGVADLLIASPFAGDGGETYLVFGRTDGFAAAIDLTALDGDDGFRIDGSSAGSASDYAGAAVSGVGDVNGDGFDDFAVGAPFADPATGGNAGETYIFFGKAGGFDAVFDLAGFDATDGFRIDGLAQNNQSGFAVGGGGDMNGDGLSDLIVGARAANSFRGEAYVFFGADSGAITHFGNIAKNIITGGDGDDVMLLRQGSDEFDAGRGNDVVRGGEGFDKGDLGSGDDKAFGGVGKDTINGQSGDDLICGEAGNDRLDIGSGADIVYGGTGDDQIFARADELGAGDRIIGGEGRRDQFVAGAGDTLDLTAPDVFTGIERIKVGGDQSVIGVDLDLRWFGRQGEETFDLGDGVDVVKASGGADVIDGGVGDDRLFGQDGDDQIIGGLGDDKLKGQNGDDVFVFGPNDGRDRIFDFTRGEDLIDLSAFGFTDFFTEVRPLLRDIGGKAVFDFDDDTRIVMLGVASGELDGSDFLLAT